jgi:putative cell wall-binding protein
MRARCSRLAAVLVSTLVLTLPATWPAAAVPEVGGDPLRLSQTGDEFGAVASYEIAAASDRIVFRQQVDAQYRLFSRPVDGSAAPVQLNPVLADGTQVQDDYAVTPDGQSVLYRARHADDDFLEVHRVPITGGAAQRVRASGAGDIHFSWQLTPDGTRVVYIAPESGRFQLYSVPATGGAPTRLNPLLTDAGREVVGFGISPDSARVVYRAKQDSANTHLYSVPTDGSAEAVRIHEDLHTGYNASQFAFSPDSTTVAYVAWLDGADAAGAYRVPIAGPGAASVPLHPPLAEGSLGPYQPEFAPDGAHIAVVVDLETPGQRALYTVPATGGAPVRLSPPAAPGAYGASSGMQWSSDASRVFFVGEFAAPDHWDAFVAPTAGPGSERVQLTSGGRQAWWLEPVPGDKYVWLEVPNENDISEVHSVPASGGEMVRLHPPIIPDAVQHNFWWAFEASGRYGVLTHEVTPDRFEVRAVPAAGGDHVLLSGSRRFHWLLGADVVEPRRVVLRARVEGEAQPGLWLAALPPAAPSAPQGVVMVPGDRQATVAWEPPADDGGTPVVRYDVVVSPGQHTATVTAAGTTFSEATAPATSVTFTGLRNGTAYTAKVTATNAAGTGAAAASAPATPEPPRGVVRWSGADRISTAVRVSAETYAPGVPVAYVATAGAFPDALAGGPEAARTGGPILLTGRTSLAAATRDELARLQPGRIVVLGGTAAVDDTVLAALQPLTTGAVERLAGPDRYATAAAIADRFPSGQAVVYVATGTNFPDALAGGAAAAAGDHPIVLTAPASLPAASRAAIARLAPARIVVLGGTGAVSDAVLADLGTLTSGTVDRLAGPDRFATGAAIAATFPAPTSTVLVATGANFPDALAGTPAAAVRGAPVILVSRDAVPPAAAAQLARLQPLQIAILGGTGAISSGVEAQLLTYLRSP